MRENEEDQMATPNELLRSIARSLDLLVKLKIRETQGDLKLNEMILMLHGLGLRPKEIAGALGKSANDVNPVLSRARKSGDARQDPRLKK
jgi:DNA-directed RNA polymerase specialized sigma24 family protein